MNNRWPMLILVVALPLNAKINIINTSASIAQATYKAQKALKEGDLNLAQEIIDELKKVSKTAYAGLAEQLEKRKNQSLQETLEQTKLQAQALSNEIVELKKINEQSIKDIDAKNEIVDNEIQAILSNLSTLSPAENCGEEMKKIEQKLKNAQKQISDSARSQKIILDLQQSLLAIDQENLQRLRKEYDLLDAAFAKAEADHKRVESELQNKYQQSQAKLLSVNQETTRKILTIKTEVATIIDALIKDTPVLEKGRLINVRPKLIDAIK